MRNSQISSVSSKFETWGLEKANLKLIDLSDNRKMKKCLWDVAVRGRSQVRPSARAIAGFYHL